jgi:aspartate/glutamate racemase
VSSEEELRNAAAWLYPGEVLPDPVRRTVSFLSSRGIWFRLGRNHAVRSCKDAANRRVRLGHEGIPLWDEFKSFFGRFVNASGKPQYVVAHCRGDRILNLGLLARELNARTISERVSAEEVRQLGLEYGLINPFVESFDPANFDPLIVQSPILQVFDTELTTRIGVPGTVMTNAGDFTWAVEFFADELAQKVDHGIVAEIAESDPEAEPRLPGLRNPKSIGIITGNAPDSGVILWTKVNDWVRDLLGRNSAGDVSMPPVVVHSIPQMGLSMELDSREDFVWHALREAIAAVGRAGVHFLAIADNTTQYFTPEIRKLCREFGIEYISMPEVVADWLRRQGYAKIALVGIRWVADFELNFSAYREPLQGIEVERPSLQALSALHELAYQVKQEGSTEAGLNRLRDILRQHVKSDVVVLALTELSLLVDRQRRKGSKTLIDPLDIYAETLARRYLGLPNT